MKRINRRQFAKTIGAAAIAAPALARVALGQTAPQNPPPADATKPPGSNLPLTAEQQERLRNVLERDARRRALMRLAPLPYDLEPAFVFAVRRKPRSGAKP
jgi:hypothetical protein